MTMNDRTKTILIILAFVAVAGGLIVYGNMTAPTTSPEEPSFTLDPITTVEPETPAVSTEEPTDAQPKVVDTTPHTHPKIGAVAAKPAGVEQFAYDTTKEKMQSAIDKLNKDSRDYEAWLELAIYEFSVFKNEKRAEEIWTFVAKDRPAMIQPVANLAQLYMKREKFDTAIMYFEKAIINEPKFLQSYSDLFAIYKTQGKSDKAIDILKKGIAADANEHYLNYLLGSYYLELGKKPEALVEYEIALARAKVTGNKQVINSLQEEINRLK